MNTSPQHRLFPGEEKAPRHWEWQAYLDRELPMEREKEIEAYLDRHPEFWAALEELQRIPRGQRKRIRNRLGSRLQKSLGRPLYRKRKVMAPEGMIWYLVAAVILLVLVAWAFFRFLQGNPV